MFRQLLYPLRFVLKNCAWENAGPKVCGLSRPAGSHDIVAVALAPISAGLHTSSSLLFGRKMRKETGVSFVEKQAVAEGENSSLLEARRARIDDRFPDLHLPARDFGGVMFKDLPIVNIKATMNNTIFNVTDSVGLTQMIRSCGYDGFKNARRGTNVAAQATGFTLGKKMMQRGFRTVRARIQGLGPGRLASLRGLNFAGVQVISVTDYSPVSWNPPRPRKQRRL